MAKLAQACGTTATLLAVLWSQSKGMPKDTLAKLAADFVILIAIGFVIACNLYFEPRITSDRIAMQWGLDGKPTWTAPKRWALWGMIALMVIVRAFIWASMTYMTSLTITNSASFSFPSSSRSRISS